MKGHTQTAGDSVHSTIEVALSKRTIWSREELYDVIKNAKIEEPKYQLHEVNQAMFFDFQRKENEKFWKQLRISQISEIKITPNGTLSARYSYADITKTCAANFDQNYPLVQCYQSKISLDAGKKKDLQSLLDHNLVPEEHRQFYEDLIL